MSENVEYNSTALVKKLEEIRAFLAEYKKRETRNEALSGGILKETRLEVDKAKKTLEIATESFTEIQKKLQTRELEFKLNEEWLKVNQEKFEALESMSSDAAKRLVEKIKKLTSEQSAS